MIEHKPSREWFREDKEPDVKEEGISMRIIDELWDGHKWIHMATRYSVTHEGEIRQEVLNEFKAKFKK